MKLDQGQRRLLSIFVPLAAFGLVAIGIVLSDGMHAARDVRSIAEQERWAASRLPPSAIRSAFAQTPPLSGAGGLGANSGKNCGTPGICYSNPLFTTGIADNVWSRTYYFGTGAMALTSSTDALVIEAGPIYSFRLKRLCIYPGIATTAVSGVATLRRTRSAVSSGGTVITPTAADPGFDGDPSGGGFTGTMRAGPSITPGTAAGTIASIGLFNASTAIATQTVCRNLDDGVFKPIIVRPGTTNGIELLFPGTSGGATAAIDGILSEQSE